MPKICVIIPCRNEAQYLENCLRAVLAFELPPRVSIEVCVLDGLSTDATATIAQKLAKEDSRVRYLLNKQVTQGCAVNTAVLEVNADFYLWLGAHCDFPIDYLAKCFDTIERKRADVVGGICETRAGSGKYGAAIVQALTTHWFGIGGGEFRIGGPEHEVDTVPYPMFRARVFRAVGLMDERLVRAQDYEFNRRIAAAGGLVWQNPQIRVVYYNQPSFRQFLAKQIWVEAPYNAYLWFLAPYAFSLRHAVTAAFCAFLFASCVLAILVPWSKWVSGPVLALYAVGAAASAVQQAIRYRRPSLVLTLPPSFFAFHFAHGVGVIVGAIRLLLGLAPVQKSKEPWPGANFNRHYPSTLRGKLTG